MRTLVCPSYEVVTSHPIFLGQIDPTLSPEPDARVLDHEASSSDSDREDHPLLEPGDTKTTPNDEK
jgi:hypothetical protein